MRTSWNLSFVLACAVTPFAACSDEPTKITPGQVLLYVDTDAPLPAGPEQRRGLAAPLFDRLRVDVYEPNALVPCAGCTNEFELNALLLEQRKASVGIAPPLHAPGYRARVRLFKAEFASKSGEPNADSTIDVTIALPAVDTNTLVEQTVFLSTEDVGHPVGSLSAPLPPVTGAPQRSRVGTWSGAQRVGCNLPPPEGAVCVPGGAYWMGNPNAPGFTPGRYVLQPRLVVLSPFFMSATEVTVRQFRSMGRTPKQSWSGASTGDNGPDWCTFTAEPGKFDPYPINCVTLADARGYCAAVGAELPTEAQFEYVEGGLAGNVFPWGRDEPTCSDAIFGRGGFGILANVDSPCKPSEPPGSPSTPGGGLRDRLDLPGGAIFDLAGNLTEWTRDVWNRIDEPCWDRAKLLRDPLCTIESPHDGALATQRGGNWVAVSTFMVASSRYAQAPDFSTIQTGFRCVWPSP